MLAFHTYMLTFDRKIANITVSIAIIVVTFAHRLPAILASMIVHVIVSAIHNSVAPIAITVLIIVVVIASVLYATFIAMTVIVIIVAIYRHPYVAIVADVIPVVVIVVCLVGIIFAQGLFSAKVTACVFILVDMIKADQLTRTLVTDPVSVLVYANIRHPFAALVTVVVSILICVSLIALHTVCGAVTAVTSSVTVSEATIICHTNSAIVAGMVVIIVTVHIVVICTIEHLLTAQIAQSVFVSINVTGTRHYIFAFVADTVAIFIYARN